MINVEDLRIGDIVQVNKDCMFPKDTLYIVTEILSDRQYEGKKGAVSLKAVNDDNDDLRWAWCCNIDGVPVTPEILRNNDFKEEVDGKTKRIVRCILPDGSPTFTITPLVKHNLQERRNAKRRKR